MSLFRSAPMRYYELFIPTEDAYSVIAKLAPENFVEFLDAASNNFHKPYYNSIKRCEDVILKIDQIIRNVKKYKIPFPDPPQVKDVFTKHEESNFIYMQSSPHAGPPIRPSSTKSKQKSIRPIMPSRTQ